MKFAAFGKCFIKAFTHCFLELCAGESGRARGEFVDGVVLGVSALLREMNGEDLLADRFSGEVDEENLIETSFAEQFRGSMSIRLAVATTNTGSFFSCIQVSSVPTTRAVVPPSV